MINIKEAAEKHEAYIIEMRRHFHQYPELSWKEFKTTDDIAAQMEKMGYEVQRFSDGRTGLYATLHGGKAAEGSRTIALRADIDALPTEEKTGLPFASKNLGVMHACGHDNHIAMLLGAAKILKEHQAELAGNVKFFFQGAEETAVGAPVYVDQGVLDGVDAIFGMHIWGNFDAPYISVETGARMASADIFSIVVEGASAHGSAPNLGVDAIVASASIISNIQTIVSRNNDPICPLVVTIGKIQGGDVFNTIANRVEMHGTVRSLSKEMRDRVEGLLRNVVENTAAAFGAKGILNYHYGPGPILNTNEEMNSIARQAAVKLYGEEGVKPLAEMMGSEDFAFFMEKVPGFYAFLGSRNRELGIEATNHNDKYTVDESVLKRGSALFAQVSIDFLNK